MAASGGRIAPHRGLRWARAAFVAALTVVVALTSHVLAGGAAGPWWGVAVVATVVTPLCWWWSDRRWRSLELLVVLGLAQGLLHILFSLSAASHSAHQMAHHATPGMADHSGTAMVLAHGLATLVTLVFVRQADAAVHALAAVLRDLVEALLPDVRVPELGIEARRSLICAHAIPVTGRWQQLRHPDRGPPMPDCSFMLPAIAC